MTEIHWWSLNYLREISVQSLTFWQPVNLRTTKCPCRFHHQGSSPFFLKNECLLWNPIQSGTCFPTDSTVTAHLYGIRWHKSVCESVNLSVHSLWCHSGTVWEKHHWNVVQTLHYSWNIPSVGICSPQCSPVLQEIFSVHLQWATSCEWKDSWAQDIWCNFPLSDCRFSLQLFWTFATQVDVRVVNPVNRDGNSIIVTLFCLVPTEQVLLRFCYMFLNSFWCFCKIMSQNIQIFMYK